MCTLLPITNTSCPQGRAGISKAWVASCTDITDLTFNATGGITAITTVVDGGFVPIDFARNAAFLNQTKTTVNNRGSLVNTEQVLSFNIDIMNPTTRNQLRVLNGCCCLHVIVRDNTGQYHYLGISHTAGATPGTTDTYVDEYMTTGEGSGNTGADPTGDINEYIETIRANVNFYAPFYVGVEADIPLAA